MIRRTKITLLAGVALLAIARWEPISPSDKISTHCLRPRPLCIVTHRLRPHFFHIATHGFRTHPLPYGNSLTSQAR